MRNSWKTGIPRGGWVRGAIRSSIGNIEGMGNWAGQGALCLP